MGAANIDAITRSKESTTRYLNKDRFGVNPTFLYSNPCALQERLAVLTRTTPVEY